MYAFKEVQINEEGKKEEEQQEDKPMYPIIRYNIFGRMLPKYKELANDSAVRRTEVSVANHYELFLKRVMETNKILQVTFLNDEMMKTAGMKKVQSFFADPKHQQIQLHDNSGFKVTDLPDKKARIPHTEYYTGLTRALKRLFYPETSDDPLNPDPETKKRKKTAVYTTSNPTTCQYVGKEHGKRVHEQIYNYILYLNAEAGEKKEQLGSYLSDGIDPCVIRIITYCIKHQWIPLVSELMIWDSKLKIATAIDILCINTFTYELVLLEVKAGFENQEYEAHEQDTCFQVDGFTEIKNCPKNRHFLQLLAMVVILKRSYSFTINEAYIIRVCPKSKLTLCYTPPTWFYENSTQIKMYRRLQENIME